MTTSLLLPIGAQFKYYKMLGNKTIERLNDEEIHWRNNEEINSVAVIVQHLHGNMMSRFTDFFTSDGEKEWRQRDKEFEKVITTRQELIQKWEEGWNCLFHALEEIEDQDLSKLVYIRHMGHTVAEALLRQLAHYAYHIGQIVYLGRIVKGSSWESLSIPKGQSKAYNKEKFNKPKHKEHFTDEFLREEDEK